VIIAPVVVQIDRLTIREYGLAAVLVALLVWAILASKRPASKATARR
jgi:hypothetical protein